MSVYAKINAVTAALSKVGIGKDQKNTFDNYNFRGIDDVYNVLSRLLAENHLVIIPRLLSSDLTVIQTSQGKATNHTKVTVRYKLVDAESDSSTYAVVPGEASDRGDKGENKAMSAAYKLLAFQLFCIPVKGNPDSEEESHDHHEVAYISGPDLEEIQGWMGKTNTNEKAFLEWQGVPSINEIPLERLPRIIDALKRKEQRMAEQYAAEQAETAHSLENS